MTLPRVPRAALLVIATALAGGGCISVPPELEADMAAPDGARPNNYGRCEEGPDGTLEEAVVRPDRPTVLAAPVPQ
jgi:hypothetical protein